VAMISPSAASAASSTSISSTSAFLSIGIANLSFHLHLC
jgi:hypothetical protein